MTESGSLPAVVLAAGRGTRMREAAEGVELTAEQAAAADRGLKALVPIGGRPFLAHVLHELAEAGFEEACLVIGPGRDDPVRRAVADMDVRRLRLGFGVQEQPRGGADAVLAAEEVVGDRPFVVVNADNLIPASVLSVLHDLDGPGLAAFERQALIRESNIPPERVAAFALVDVKDGYLEGIVEKPDPEVARARAGDPVSMTCWRFEPSMFDACRSVTPSPRGELELPDAVALAVERGARLRVVPVAAGVLDLSRREDIPDVERRLAGREPRP
jgi:glucose-1-phosphate thymidylyltransferase